jgi:hypothetical protein
MNKKGKQAEEEEEEGVVTATAVITMLEREH